MTFIKNISRDASRTTRKFAVFLSALCLSAAADTVYAVPVVQQAPSTTLVYEYFNTGFGDYFYTSDPSEIDAIRAGIAGAGWVRTGLSFLAYPSIEQSGNSDFPTCDKHVHPCATISRFYGTPGVGPNSHFFTGDPEEAGFLKRPGSGWGYEGVAFAIPLPERATGQCAQGLTPVYRLYNNRWMFNESYHRYTTSVAVRGLMQSAGWIDEGIAFCAYGGGSAPLVQYAVEVKEKSGIQDQEICNSASLLPHSCVAFNKLPVPATEYSPYDAFPATDAFSSRTGIYKLGNPAVSKNMALLNSERETAAQNLFVQLTEGGTIFGIHLVGPARAGSPYASITPMQKLPVSVPAPGALDARLFPFRQQFNTGYELRMDLQLGVNQLSVSEGSDIYGAATIEFADTRSGGRFRANILAWGTAPEGDFVGKDATDGTILVGTSFRPQSPFGRNISGLTAHMPANYRPLAPSLVPFIWQINRAEFKAMVDQARSLAPALSADPGDYLVASFGVKNEVFGSGDVALYVNRISLALMPQ